MKTKFYFFKLTQGTYFGCLIFCFSISVTYLLCPCTSSTSNVSAFSAFSIFCGHDGRFSFSDLYHRCFPSTHPSNWLVLPLPNIWSSLPSLPCTRPTTILQYGCWGKDGKQGLLCITHIISPEQSTHTNALKDLWDSQREKGVNASSVCRGDRAVSEDH